MTEMAATPNPGPMHAGGLERALTLVDGAVAGAAVPAAARRVAQRHALALFESCDGTSEAGLLAVLGYAADLLCLVAVDLAARPRDAARLINEIEKQARVPRIALGREMLQTGRLLELPVEVAIEVRLALLVAFTDARAVTLWTLRPGGELGLVSSAGQFDPDSQITRDAARRLLEHGARESEIPRSTYGIRIERLRPPPAALVAEGVEPAADNAPLLFAATAPVLAALLDRETLHAREHPAQDSVVGSVERRLARLRFDLHDGPQQDVHLLAQDLNLFREQLRPMIAGDPNAERLLGRLDDLDAQLVALDGDLRRLSTSVQSPFLTPGSLPDALRQVSEAFGSRTGVEPEITLSGSLVKLTDSQQITLLALIREALSNIRKHSAARNVTITIESSSQGIRAEITDDGNGFDPETTLVRAARAGRLGLVGMHERVRMLGGRTQIESRPGGPTVISATLPPWPSEREP
jgi:signal transduction histidine kinase